MNTGNKTLPPFYWLVVFMAIFAASGDIINTKYINDFWHDARRLDGRITELHDFAHGVATSVAGGRTTSPPSTGDAPAAMAKGDGE